MLAGRKLLLADDSFTIQKIVALTFAEEGIEVIAVSDGAEAIEKLEETSPDVVLADVFMPRMSGYQVCEHIKQTERLKHIPVMLMVGSFEPFDEVEARRVGADDILTKPFQSIRTLMDKVGALLGRGPAVDPSQEGGPSSVNVAAVSEAPFSDTLSDISAHEETPVAVAQEANTQELAPPEFMAPPEEPMTTDELEITTADTQPLSPEIRDRMEHLESGKVVETVLEAEPMPVNLNTDVNPNIATSPERSARVDDALLDLDQFETAGFDANEDVILDIDFDEPPPDFPSTMPPLFSSRATGSVAVESRFEARAFSPAYSPAVAETVRPSEIVPAVIVTESLPGRAPDVVPDDVPEIVDAQPVEQTVAASVTEVQEPVPVTQTEVVSSPAPAAAAPTGLITLEQLAPEVVDELVRRAVEQLSERAIQEIAWEVVPQLSELMIKRKLEKQEDKNK